MSGWQTTTLGDIFEISSSKRVLQSDWKTSGVPFYRAREVVKLARNGEVENELFISEELFQEYSSKYGAPEEGDLMVSAVGTLGACYVVRPNDRFYYKDASVLRFKPKQNICSSFFQHAFRTTEVLDQVHSGSGSTVGTYTIERANATKVRVPPLPEQRRIAAILDKADALRTQRREALAQLDRLAQAIFVEMFGDPTSTSLIFSTVPLIELAQGGLQNGAYFPKEMYSPNGIEMVHMSDAFGGVVKRGDLRRVACGDDDISKYELNEKDLLIARRSLTYEGAAKPCRIPASDEPLLFESSFIRIRPELSKVSTLFLFHYLNSERVREKFVRPFVTQSTISGINQSNLARVPVIVPPIDLQLKFERTMASVDETVQVHQRASIALDGLFAAAQHRAFRGEL
jgi:type I restriction enzyme S subunit